MDVQWLREHANHLKVHLIHFKQMHQMLEGFYQQSLSHIHDQAVKSSLMETYSIHLDRQQKAIQHMAQLYQQALDQLALIEASSNQG